MEGIWDKEAIGWEDLPTVSDLLRAADKKLLAREVVEAYPPALGRLGKKRLKRARAEIRRTLKEMRGIEPVKSGTWVLLPKHACNVTGDVVPKGYSVAACALTRENLEALAQRGSAAECKRGELAGYSYLHARWADALGYRVWLGGEWSRRERYLFLADILREMTFWGMTQGEHDENAAADLREIEEAKSQIDAEIEAAGGLGRYMAAMMPSDAPSEGRATSHPAESYRREYEAAARRLDGMIAGLLDDELLGNIRGLAARLAG